MAGLNEVRVATLGLGIDASAAQRGASKWSRANKKVRAEAKQTANTTQGAFNSINFSSALRRLKIFAAAMAAAWAAFKTVDVASDAQEIQSKFDVVFGEGAEAANKWSADFGKAVGRANQDVKQFASTVQDTLVPMGIQRDTAAKLTKEIVKLGVDVASFNNKADDEVIANFTSALVGNAEGVRKYGIVITEARMKTEALTLGITKNYQELSEAEKLLIRYSIIQKGTTDAQGDAIRTGESYANQVKRMRGNIKNLAETVGKALLPAWTHAVKLINSMLEGNTGKIKYWAETARAYIIYVIDVAKSFIGFMREDWKAAIGVGLDMSISKFEEWGRKLIVVIEKIVSYIAVNVPVMIKRGMARWKLEESITNQVTKQVGAAAKGLSDKVLGAQMGLTPEQMQQKMVVGGKTMTGREIAEEVWRVQEIEKYVSSELAAANARIEAENPLRGGRIFEGMKEELASVSSAMAAERAKILTQVAQTEAGGEFVGQLKLAKDRLTTELGVLQQGDALAAAGDGTNAIAENMGTAADNAFNLQETLKQVGKDTIKATANQKKQMEMVDGMANTIGSTFKGAFDDALQGTFDLRKSMQSLFANIASQLMQELIIAQMIAAVRGAFGGVPVAAGANGMVIGQGGKLMAFADGGIVSKPTMFPMAGGMGLMGEKGPEAVMPLQRGSDGKLGVQAQEKETKINIVNVTDKKEVASVLASPEGTKIIMNTLRRNKQATRQMIG
jgi:hypothetical protein